MALLGCLAGCANPSGVRVTEGNEPVGSAPTGTLVLAREATVVHVNENDRLATLRRAQEFTAGTFLATRNSDGERTGLLKTRPNRQIGLRTADILEGLPEINDEALPVSRAERARLVQAYPDLPVE
jgi:hypothetical protein